MARPEPKFDKLMEVNNLNQGDKVKLTNGDIAEFVRLKQKNFVGIINSKSYNIPVNMFASIESKAEKKETNEGYKTLKKDELFYITDQKKGHALLFKFEGLKNGKIVGISPITGGSAKIDSGLYAGKVSEL
jgi:UDP:flavonoid glycosyltransferase YjiC (YdhE family)